jgi:DNA (cytosine-5)-methyltransferase 1
MLGEGVRAACELLGVEHRTVCYVEREAPAAAQLARLMEAGALDPAPIWSDLLTFDGAAWRGCVDFIVAGFPCQDISIAGRRAGLDGQRSGLFFDILDLADDCGAHGLVLENVSAIATATATAVDEAEGALFERAAARVVGELADRGWDAEWITLSASDVGASHGRARWFCLAWRRVADTGHGPRTHQPLGIGRRGGPSDDCAGRQAVDDAHHPVGQGR